MTELSFLLELFLDNDCPTTIRTRIVERIRALETLMQPVRAIPVLESVPPPVAPERIAQTQATAKMMAERQQVIAASLSGKPLTNADGSKRKF